MSSSVYFLLCCQFLLVTSSFHDDFTNHPCKRECVQGKSMVCEYELSLESYYTMQPDCGNCTHGVEKDCYNKLCMPGDGRCREISVFNSMMPGPKIEVCQGDTVIVYFQNHLEERESTIHWHGMHQHHTQEMDGVPMITQCPVCYRNNFTYRFIATEAGTHFYHSHSGSQRADGAYGPFIVRQPDTKTIHRKLYDQDLSEHIISLIDWLPARSEQFRLRYVKTKQFYDDQEINILINGFGQAQNVNVPNPKCYVKKGLRYRFRVIHAGNIVSPMRVQIANHSLKVFYTDSDAIVPETVDILTITNGERYDFVLDANQAVGKYEIDIQGTFICGANARAILVYEGAEDGQEVIDVSHEKEEEKRILNCHGDLTHKNCLHYHDLRNVGNNNYEQLLGEPRLSYYFGFDQYFYDRKKYEGVGQDEMFEPLINLIHYVPAPKPLLLVRGQETCNYETTQSVKAPCHGCTHVVEIENNALIEFIFYDMGQHVDLIHPMHFHGHRMAVFSQVKIGDALSTSTMSELVANNTILRNFERPVFKDTVSVPDGGYTIVRFISDNPGCWLLHCHVDFHSEEGMQVAICTKKLPKVKYNSQNKCL